MSFEVGTLTSAAEEAPAYDAPAAEAGGDYGMEGEFGLGEIPLGADGEPDFDAMVADEYLDPDLDLEEDALVDALNEIEAEEKKRKL